MTKRWTGLVIAAMAMTPLAAPAALHAQDHNRFASDSETFLTAVSKLDYGKAMELISKPGSAVVNYRGREGEAAIHIVTRLKSIGWVNLLLMNGADIDLPDAQGNTALLIAARTGQGELVSQLLRYGAKVNAANRRGETPLIAAVQARQTGIVEALLKKGADPDISDNYAGLSAREYAARDTRNPKLLALIEGTRQEPQFTFGPAIER